MKIAFITGITGQDGSYLAEFLLSKGYIVHGLKRRTSSLNTQRIDHIYQDKHDNHCRLFLHYGDLSDSGSIERLIFEIKPDEVYNLAAMSHVRVSFDLPEYTGDIDGIGTTRLLEACRRLNKKVKFYQACTSELYGGIYQNMQNESTPFCPRSPYAVAKLYAYWITKNYRESYDMYTVNGILFNHTSERRGETFVEQKIVKGAVAIKYGLQDCLYLGNLYTYRDIGHAKDYVKAMWMMLQHPEPDDYVIATGKKHLIKDIVETVFGLLGIYLQWYGEGDQEHALWGDKIVIRIDSQYYRPSEVESLHGDPSKAMNVLRWKPEYDLNKILLEMIDHEQKNIHIIS